jgi:hypothetical protein
MSDSLEEFNASTGKFEDVVHTKQCSKCKKEKPFSDFNKHPNTKSGLQSRCKRCVNNFTRKRKWVRSNKGIHLRALLIKERDNLNKMIGHINAVIAILEKDESH